MKFKPESTVLLDIKGLLQYSLNRGNDPDAVLNSKGKNFNTAAHGFNVFFETMLQPILETVAPRRIIAVWDKDGEDFRTGIYPQYKQKRRDREKDPIESAQYEKLFEITDQVLLNLGCTLAYVRGVEADDVIAAMVQRLRGHKQVWTVDADLLQLQSDSVDVSVRGEFIYEEYKGVPLHLICLHKSLLGDSSDGYIGVRGFGEKAWQHCIEEFGEDGMLELEQCVKTGEFDMLKEALDQTGDKVLNLIYENRHDWVLQYNLAMQHPELIEGRHGGKMRYLRWQRRVPNHSQLLDGLKALGADDLYHDLADRWLPRQVLITQDNIEELARMKQYIDVSPFVPFDYESYDTLNHEPFQKAAAKSYVDVLSQSITGAGFTFGDNFQHTAYISVNHKDTANVSKKSIFTTLDEIVTKEKDLVVQNANFELTLTDNEFGVRLPTVVDTAILASYVNENKESGLKQSTANYLKYKQTTYAEVIGDAKDMSQLTGEQVLGYGADDPLVTGILCDLYNYILQMEEQIDFPYENDMEAANPIVDAFEAGVPIDFELMSKLEEKDAVILEESEKKIRELLEKHCTTYNEKAADYLYKDLAEYETKVSQMDDGDEAKLKQKLENLYSYILEGTKYRPLVVEKKEVKFTPGKGDFNKIIEKLGIGIELQGIASNKVTEWLAETSDHVDAYGMKAKKFRDLLADAAGNLRKGSREGSDYEALEEFCLGVLKEDAPEVVHGDELNLGSPKQMQVLLYGKLGLPIRMRSKVQHGSKREKLDMHGSPGTDEAALRMAIAEDTTEGDWKRELLESILAYKEVSTRFSLYYKPYPLWVRPDTNRVHGGIKNCGTNTRRPTGSSPNFLQISKDGGLRNCFLPQRDWLIIDGQRHNIDEEHVIVSADFAGQELRLMTSESKDPVLLDAYIGENQKDIHTVTAAAIAPIVVQREAAELYPQLEIDPQTKGVLYEAYVTWLRADHGTLPKLLGKIRNMAKAVNFLIIYGGGYTTLARNLLIPAELAKMFIEDVMKTYKRIIPWQKETTARAMDQGYIETAYGSRRHIRDLLLEGADEHRVSRQAVNYTIQGCAADILKVVLREIHRTRLFHETKSVMLAPIYDEIAASVPKSAVLEYCTRLKRIMEVTPPGHQVPMLAEFSIGQPTWGSKVEIGAVIDQDKIGEVLEYKEAA